MPALSDASGVYVGAVPAAALYVGDGLAWSGMDDATRAYLDAAGSSLNGYEQTLDDLVVGLKDHTLWTPVVRCLHPFPGVSAAVDRFNLLDPRPLTSANYLTLSGGTHSTALGYRANALGTHRSSANHADTHFVPRSELAANSAGLVFYCTQDTPGDGQCEMGAYAWDGNGGNRHHLLNNYGGGSCYYDCSTNGITSTIVPNASGLFITTRTAANLQSLYRNGALVDATSYDGIAHPNVSIHIGRINTFQDGTDRPCGLAAVTQGFSAQNAADLYTVVQAYQTALGRAV